MDFEGIERRTCIRFEIPGATVSYKLKRPLLAKTSYGEEFCPTIDLSRGGLRFLSKFFFQVFSADKEYFMSFRSETSSFYHQQCFHEKLHHGAQNIQPQEAQSTNLRRLPSSVQSIW